MGTRVSRSLAMTGRRGGLLIAILVMMLRLSGIAPGQKVLYMPDGQLFTRPLKIHVDAIDMSSELVPRLLRKGEIWTGKIVAVTEEQRFTVAGKPLTGTLFLKVVAP